MSRISISVEALQKLNTDLRLGDWKRDPRPDQLPLLRYYRRLYSTAWDGTVTEHGDGFHLAFVDPDEDVQPHIAGYERVALGDGHDILVEIQTSFPAGPITIGWSKTGYRFEPRANC